jgi:hypothetical protein
VTAQSSGLRTLSADQVASRVDQMVWDLDPADWASIACRIAGRNLSQSEWKQYLSGRPYQVKCTQWPVGT